MVPLYISDKLFTYLSQPTLDWITSLVDEGYFINTKDGWLLYGTEKTKKGVMDIIPEFQLSYIDSDGEYLSYTNSKDITYTKNPYSLKREKTTLGKLLNRLAIERGITPPPVHVLGDWAAHYKSNIITNKLEFKLVDKKEIAHYYNENTYCEYKGEGSTLHNSCMRKLECQPYMGIYTENPSVCKMMICLDTEGKLYGRAIIWETDHGILMDRVYYAKEYVKHLFTEHAKKEQWFYKKHQNSNENFEVMGGPNNISDKRMIFDVQLSKWDFDTYPHMDTLDYLNMETGIITNRKMDKEASYRKLKTICGQWE